MKLTVFNGSPRGKGSNSRILLEQFLRGFETGQGNTHELFYLNRPSDAERFSQAFAEAENVLLAFPLYTDAMPGTVKAFIETLEPFRGRTGNPRVGFIVQSGFPEAEHSRHVERYLVKLAARLGCRYIGTIVKGGVEGIQVKPPGMTRKLFAAFENLGEIFGESGQFDEALTQRLAKPEKLPKWATVGYSILAKTGLMEFYWNKQLKENGVYEKRFAKPYAE
jgi:NAD(P)H-dependent FMN reductase